MSDFALKLHLPDDDDRPIERTQAHGTRWLWLDDAARLMGVHEGTLRRRCIETWGAKLLARKAKRDNGQEAWQVSELADPRLVQAAPVAVAGPAVCDLSPLTDAQREQVLERERLVKDWQAQLDAGETLGLCEKPITDRFIAQVAAAGVECSRGSLYRWRKAYRDHGRKGLFDPRWRVERDASAAGDLPVYRDALKRLWLTQRQLSMRQAHERASALAEQSGETPPSYKTAQRILNAVPRNTAVLLREGDTAYTNKIERFVSRDYSTINTNDWWCSDHFRFDVIVRTPEGELTRPWLHAWQDMRSRRIVGYAIVTHDPNADLILRVFAQAVREHGAPLNVYVDNGKDFDAGSLQTITKAQRRAGVKVGDLSPDMIRRLGGAFVQLGVEVTHAQPYHGQSKVIERWHRRINDQFSRDFESYTGGDTTRKPEDLAMKLKADHIPTLEYFRQAFGEWVDGYNAVPHMGDSMDGRSPDAVYEACLVARRPVAEASLRLACAVRVAAKIRQNGVHHQGMSWHAPELDRRFGENVIVAIDVGDLSRVSVLERSGKPICVARANERLPQGASRQHLREAMAEKRQHRRIARTYMDARPKMTLDPVDLMRHAAAKRAGDEREREQASARLTGTDDTPPPPSIQPIRTPFDGQATALRIADERPDGARPGTADAAVEDTGSNHGRFTYARTLRDFEEDDRE